jgi:hypothetical protein
VLFAGGMKITNGTIKFIESGSGHYEPGPTQMLHCLEALLAHGVTLNQIWVQDWPLQQVALAEGGGLPLAANAMKYLSKRGKINRNLVDLGGDCKYFDITTC